LKSRIVILFSGLVVLWGILVLRAAVLQVLPNQRLETLQNRQFQTVITLQNRRGAIVDRHGRELAMSTKAYSVYADPKLIEGRKATAKKLASILGIGPEAVFAKIKDPKKRFVWIQRILPEDKAQEIKALDIKGLQIVEEFKRVYPNEDLLSQVIGFVGQEGQGLEGLELSFDPSLQGKKNKVTVRRDARGRPLVADGLMFAENPDGAEIKLTVDADLQHMLETELNQAISEFEADNAMGVILDAKTSAILAMSSAPSFDANKAAKLKPEQRRNRAVTDAYEPGSTLKTFVVATALKEKIVQPNTKYDTENGRYQIGNRVIKEAEIKEKWQNLTVSEILAYSSNIGTTKIAMDLGPESLRKGLIEFGFGQKSGVDLPGDSRGLMQALPWRQHLLANISFGHGIAVTSLQMANAYAAIANGGVLNTPYIVQSIRDPETGETTEFQPKVQRRVLSSEDASSLRLMLAGVTSPGGTGINAKVDGFPVGGKTGTAQKVNPAGGGYLKNAYVSSFAGFIPATEPKFVIYVMVDHPKKKNSYYGSQVAAPVFSRMASYAVRREGLPAVLLSEKNFADKENGSPLLRQKQKAGKKPMASVVPVKPEAAAVAVPEIQTVTASQLLQDTEPQVEMVPDLGKLTMREVLKKVSGQDLQVKFRGTGLVSEVVPASGSPLPANKKILVILRPAEDMPSTIVH
jgi:cell division protein FtsI (penicillin-binding protein 3)